MGLSSSYLYLLQGGNNTGKVGNIGKVGNTGNADKTQEITQAGQSGGSASSSIVDKLNDLKKEVEAKKTTVDAEMSNLICLQQELQWPKKPSETDPAYNKDGVFDKKEFEKAKEVYSQQKEECKAKSAEYGQQIKVLYEQIQKLADTIKELDNAISNAASITEADLAALELQVNTQVVPMEDFSLETVPKESAEVQGDAPEVTGASEKEAELQGRLAELDAKLAESEKEIAQFSGKENEVHYNIRFSQRKIDVLINKLSPLELKLKAGGPDPADWYKTDGSFDGEGYNNALNEYEADQKEAESLSKELETEQQKLKEYFSEQSDLSYQLATLAEEHSELVKERDSVQAELQSLLEAKETETEEDPVLKEVSDKFAEVEDLFDRYLELGNEIFELHQNKRSNPEEFNSKIGELEAEQNNIGSQIMENMANIDQLSSQTDGVNSVDYIKVSTEKQLANFKEQIDSLKNEYMDLLKHYAHLGEYKDEMLSSEEYDKIEQRFKEISNELSNIESKNFRLSNSIRELYDGNKSYALSEDSALYAFSDMIYEMRYTAEDLSLEIAEIWRNETYLTWDSVDETEDVLEPESVEEKQNQINEEEKADEKSTVSNPEDNINALFEQYGNNIQGLKDALTKYYQEERSNVQGDEKFALNKLYDNAIERANELQKNIEKNFPITTDDLSNLLKGYLSSISSNLSNKDSLKKAMDQANPASFGVYIQSFLQSKNISSQELDANKVKSMMRDIMQMVYEKIEFCEKNNMGVQDALAFINSAANEEMSKYISEKSGYGEYLSKEAWWLD